MQPRTNRNLSATWAVSRRDVAGDTDLHMLNQQGAYWRVKGDGSVAFVKSSGWARNARGWSDLGNRDGQGVHQDLVASSNLPTSRLIVTLLSPGSLSGIGTRPWAPKDSAPVFHETSNHWVPNNWIVDTVPTFVFEGFAVHPWAGTTFDRGSGIRETWYWSARGIAPNTVGDWGNLIEGFRVSLTSNEITGLWASTGEYNAGGIAKCPHHNLRSFTTATAVMTLESLKAVWHPDQSGRVVLVVGCPGGSVRVMIPGNMRIDANAYHDLALPSVWESEDLGFGGSALAVRQESGSLTIWFGTLTEPCARPGNYGAGDALGDQEVAAGAVHKMTWTESGGLSPVAKKVLYPNTVGLPRGGYGVIGLAVADVIGGTEEEVIVGTLGGEVIVLDEDLSQVLWRANVPGSVGFFNSIHVDDLDGLAGNEIYVSGSFGVWRFR